MLPTNGDVLVLLVAVVDFGKLIITTRIVIILIRFDRSGKF